MDGQVPAPAAQVRVAAGRREGRGHRARGSPCQDAYAVHEDPAMGRAVAAVADGLGSRPLSQLGSQAACAAAVASLAAEAAWDEAALRRAFVAARAAGEAAAAAAGLGAGDLATTLQVAGLAGGRAVAAMVGDGAIVAAGAGAAGAPAVLLQPAPSEFANLVVPVTDDAWEESFRCASRDGAAAVVLMTDGLTRLLLTRDAAGWDAYAPFFDPFLARLRTGPADAALAQRFLDSAEVDRAWDDDKCLVALAAADPREAGHA